MFKELCATLFLLCNPLINGFDFNYNIDPQYTKKLLAVTLGLFEKYPHLFKSEEIWEYYKNNKKT
jgi:hypothetical protein